MEAQSQKAEDVVDGLLKDIVSNDKQIKLTTTKRR